MAVRRAQTCRLLLPALVAGAVLGLCVAPSQGQRRWQSVDVLLLGSSSVNGPLGITIERELRAQNVTVRRRFRLSSGFARPDFYDWNDALRHERLDGVRMALIYIGGNDTQGLWLRRSERASTRSEWVRWQDQERWATVYQQRVVGFIDRICDGGVGRVLVLPPVEGEREEWTARLVRVQRAQADAARQSRCGAVLDVGAFERGTLSTTRDGVHLDWEGARTVWDRIAPQIRSALGDRS